MDAPTKDRSGGGFGQPATHVFTITPGDSAYLDDLPRGIYVGGAGDLAVMTIGGSIAIFVGLVAGTIVPVRAVRVYATGTTATSLLGLI